MRADGAALSVLLLCRYSRLGASSRLRFLDYMPALSCHDIHVEPSPFFDDAYLAGYYAGRRDLGAIVRAYLGRLRVLLAPGRRPDLVWIEKEVLPWLPGWIERRLLDRFSYVIDFDDAWALRYQAHRSPLVRRVLGRKWERLLPGAQLVLCGSANLQDWAEHTGARRTLRVPTVVDLDRYPVIPPAVGSVCTIGWIGTASTLPHLAMAAEALRRVCADGRARLRLIANQPIDLPGVPTEFLPWREDDEAEMLAGVDVGIMPLPDEPWERGKCAYKLIQYMAAGRPVVASPVGANIDVVEHGVTGFLATAPDDWITALNRLKGDAGLRAAMGAAGRRRVEEEYCLQAQAGRVAAALRAAAEGCGNP